MKKVLIDKDYCSSTVWCDGGNWEESDFDFNEEQLTLAKEYDNLWEDAHKDICNVDYDKYLLAEEAKSKLLDNLFETRKDIIWTYWCGVSRSEVVYKGVK